MLHLITSTDSMLKINKGPKLTTFFVLADDNPWYLIQSCAQRL